MKAAAEKQIFSNESDELPEVALKAGASIPITGNNRWHPRISWAWRDIGSQQTKRF
jgi:hypothetical protein